MRKLITVVMLFAAALPSPAARRVTVAELQQILIDRRAAGKPDADTAKQVGSLELSEQLTNSMLAKLMAQLNPGPMTAQMLKLVADESALLAPPAAEVSGTPKPDVATQSKIIHSALAYVAGPLRGLPDLQLVQSIYSFNNSPIENGQAGYAPPSELHAVGTSHRDVNYHNGRATPEKASARQKDQGVLQGLQGWGEFGPLLAIVLGDGARGTV